MNANPNKVITASVWRRSLAYLLDASVFLLPLAACIFILVALGGFEPVAWIGTVAVVVFVLLGVIYGLFLASQNASRGQTLGKKIVGLRILRNGSGETAGLWDSILRGSAFFSGLLALGIPPIVAALRIRRRAQDSGTWYNKLADTTLVDIERGPDPMFPEPEHYDPYPEQWGSLETRAPITVFPPAAPKWSPLYQEDTPRREVERTIEEGAEESGERKRRRILAPVLQLAAIGVLSVILLVGGGLGTTAIQAALTPAPATAEVSASALAANVLPFNRNSSPGAPTFGPDPVWNREVPETAALRSSEAGTFIFNDRTLTVINNADGSVALESELTGNVSITQETLIGDVPSMVWQIGADLYAWNSTMKNGPAKYSLPENATLTAAGDNLLISSSNGETFSLSPDGIVPVTVPTDRTALAVDGNQLLSAKFGPTLTLSNFKGQERQEISFDPPRENVQIKGWVTAGHGVATVLWSAFPESTDPENPVYITVYDTKTGKTLSSLEVPQRRIDQDPNWTRGQGFQWASFAGYIFDLSTGKPIIDLEAQNFKRSGIYGDSAVGEVGEDTVLIRNGAIWGFSDISPLAVVGNRMIANSSNGELRMYSS